MAALPDKAARTALCGGRAVMRVPTATTLPRGLRHLLDGRQGWSKSGRKDVEMHLHVNGIASLRRPDRPNGDDVIVPPIVWSAGDGFEPVAELGGMGGLFIGVVSRLVIPSLVDHEPIGPARLL